MGAAVHIEFVLEAVPTGFVMGAGAATVLVRGRKLVVPAVDMTSEDRAIGAAVLEAVEEEVCYNLIVPPVVDTVTMLHKMLVADMGTAVEPANLDAVAWEAAQVVAAHRDLGPGQGRVGRRCSLTTFCLIEASVARPLMKCGG